MRHNILLIAVLLVGTTTNGLAQQAQSDYQIQKEFKQKVDSLNQAIVDASTVSEIEILRGEVDTLAAVYDKHAELINRAIYPDRFQDKIDQLNRRSMTVSTHLATIEKQEKRLQDLNTKLTDYGSRLNQLSGRADSLLNVVQRTSQNENQLSNQLQNYRQSLEERDQLVFSIIDSVSSGYRDMNIGLMDEIESSRSRINSEDGPLALVRAIPLENIQVLESNSKLAVEDYLRMKAVEREFASMWRKVGDNLAKIYSDNPEQAQTEVDQAASKWREMLNKRLWSSMNQAFDQANVDLATFEDSNSFFNALNTYVNQSITRSEENNEGNAYSNYSNFVDFWNNRIKSQWGPYLNRSDMLSNAQISAIDQKVTKWAAIAKPESHLFAYLFGASVLAIVVLGVMLFREKGGGGRKESNPKDD